MDVMALRRSILVDNSFTLSEHTATGNPLSFETNMVKTLKSLIIPFAPTQTGTGDPSPDNVRPIYGRTSLNIYHAGEDTHSPDVIPVSWQASHGEIYGGTFDAVTGILTVEYILVSGRWGDQPEAYSSETVTERVLRLNATTYGTSDTGWNKTCFCNVARVAWTGTADETAHFYIGYSGTYKTYCVYLYLPAGTSDDITVKVVAKLKEPITVQLDPVTIKTLIGNNTIWSDTNEINEAVYLKK